MRRWIFAAILLLAAVPSMWADGHGHGHGRGHWKGHGYGYGYAPRSYVGFQMGYYPAPRPMYVAPPPMWAPAYAPVPVYYRTRFRPVPVEEYEYYGPVPYGCRRAYLDGYVVDYRPSNFLVVRFARAW